jgi:hypothetical protein
MELWNYEVPHEGTDDTGNGVYRVFRVLQIRVKLVCDHLV